MQLKTGEFKTLRQSKIMVKNSLDRIDVEITLRIYWSAEYYFFESPKLL